MKDELAGTIKFHDATAGIIELGDVGLPLVLRFGEVGFEVVGFDVDPAKVAQSNAGTSTNAAKREP